MRPLLILSLIGLAACASEPLDPVTQQMIHQQLMNNQAITNQQLEALPQSQFLSQ